MHAVVKYWTGFWFERAVSTSRLAALRVLFFGLLGLDQLYLMVEKAYRYGTGDFNVAHFELLDWILPIPSPVVHAAIYLVCGFLALRVASGIAVRASLFVLLPLYSYAYFSSMHDGYQHHYLMVWLLLISLAIPFEQTGGVDTPLNEDSPRYLKSWGVQLLYAQVSIVYLFTALTKATPKWLDGWALEQQISRPWLRDSLASMESQLGLGQDGIYALIAHAVLIWQVIAAASFIFPRLRVFACISGPLFHIMVEVIGLEIRWFSYYMVALYYLLLFPETWYTATEQLFARLLRPASAAWSRLLRPRPLSPTRKTLLVVGGAILSALLGALIPLPGAGLAGIAFGVLVLAAGLRGSSERTQLRTGLQVLFACVALLLCRCGDVGYNYFRWKGGDHLRRGELEHAAAAYTEVIRLRAGSKSRHAKLAMVLARLGRYEEAAEMYTEALRLNPGDAKVQAGLAQVLRQLGRTPSEAQDE